MPFSLLVSAPPSVCRSSLPASRSVSASPPLSLCTVPRFSWSTPSDRYGPPTGPLAPVQGTAHVVKGGATTSSPVVAQVPAAFYMQSVHLPVSVAP